MSEPSIEEIVARVELDLGCPPDPHEPDEAFVGGIIYVGELRTLIASWRERGEALKEARDVVERANEERWAGAFGALHSIDAALKEQP